MNQERVFGCRVYQWHQNQNRPTVAVRRTVKTPEGVHQLLPKNDPDRFTVNVDAEDHAAIGRAVVEAVYGSNGAHQ